MVDRALASTMSVARISVAATSVAKTGAGAGAAVAQRYRGPGRRCGRGVAESATAHGHQQECGRGGYAQPGLNLRPLNVTQTPSATPCRVMT
jgi:hypothetical protein